MTAPAKLAMRAFKLLAKAGAAAIIWTLLNWEDVTPNWEDITDLWEG